MMTRLHTRTRAPSQVRERHLQATQGEMRLYPIKLLAEGQKGLRQAARGDDRRCLRPRPAALDAAHDAIDGVGLPEHHARTDAVFGPSTDDVCRYDELRRR